MHLKCHVSHFGHTCITITPAHQRQIPQLVHQTMNRNGKLLFPFLSINILPTVLYYNYEVNWLFDLCFVSFIPQSREALNLTESPTHAIKRERETTNDFDRDDRDYVMPASKKNALHQLHTQLQQSQRASPHNHYSQHETHRRRSVTPPSPSLHHHRMIERDHGHEHRNGLINFHENQNHSSSRRHMSASPPSTNHRNGTNNTSHNGSNDLLNACSPLAMLSGMQFKLFSRGKPRSR